MSARGTITALLFVLAVFAVPQVAGAATAKVDDQIRGWRYAAAPGERNDLAITTRATTSTLHDPAGITPGEGCRAVDAATVVCDSDNGAARMGDRGDRAVAKGAGRVTLHGDAGDDILVGGSGADFIEGDYGNDRITGNAGGDQLHGKDGRDRILGADRGPDIILCSRNIDTVVADRVDELKACENRRLVGRLFSTIDQEIAGGEIDAEELERGHAESIFTVKCRLKNAPCDASAQIVRRGQVIARSKLDERSPGFVDLVLQFPLASIGHQPHHTRIPITVKLTVKQRGRVEHRSVPMTMVVWRTAGNRGD